MSRQRKEKTRQRIDKSRRRIDLVDEGILSLLHDRAKIVKSIGRLKKKSGDDVYASGRERQILDRLINKNKNILPDDSVEQIFESIIAACRSLQKKLRVAYLGPEATFTHQASLKHFGPNAEYLPGKSISDVFDDVEKGRADTGVVPVENSTEGVVNHTLDMFMESELSICAEREELISHHLLSVSGDIRKVKSIYSHPQALAQCRRWLEAHLPQVTLHEAATTADAAAHAALDATSAAIASPLAGKLYHLKIVAGRIEDSRYNATRFLIIGPRIPGPSGHDKTSILFSIKDKIGALHEMLIPFEKNHINLTKIESRPTRKKAWEYVFYVDFSGHETDAHVKNALKELREKCVFLKVLGSYPRGDK